MSKEKYTDEETREYLLEIQKRQLEEWAAVLKPEVSKELKEYILSTNEYDEVKADMWKIKRGINIESHLQNVLIKKYLKK